MRTLKVADPAELYERDFVAWALSQAAELRQMRDARSNTALDLANLAEELAGLARSDKRTARSHVRTILEHLLKLDHSPAEAPRDSAVLAIARDRRNLEIATDELTPTIRRDLERKLPNLYRDARRYAARALANYGEHDAARALPTTCPWTLDDILRDGFYSTAMSLLEKR